MGDDNVTYAVSLIARQSDRDASRINGYALINEKARKPLIECSAAMAIECTG